MRPVIIILPWTQLSLGLQNLGLKTLSFVTKYWKRDGTLAVSSRRRTAAHHILGFHGTWTEGKLMGGLEPRCAGLTAASGSLSALGRCRWWSPQQLWWAHLGLTLEISVFITQSWISRGVAHPSALLHWVL